MASSHTSRSRAVATRQRGHRARRRQGGAAGEYLVVHEGEEGRDHERDALADHRRQLVAQALPCPGRQQHEGVLPRPPVGSPHSHRLDGEPGLCVGTGGWGTGREPGVCVCGFVAAVGSGNVTLSSNSAGTSIGKFIGIEVKSRRGTQRQSQERFQTMLERAGGRYIVARSVAEALIGLADG